MLIAGMQAANFAIEFLPPSPNHLSAVAIWVLSDCHFPAGKLGQVMGEEIDGTNVASYLQRTESVFFLIKVKAKAE